jgi:hypothetical protein
MEMSSFWRAVLGMVGRIAVLGVGLRLTIGGLRVRLSARVFSRIPFWGDEKDDANTNGKSIRGCELRNDALQQSLLAGSNWDNGTNCSSQCQNANNYQWNTNSNIGTRFLADPGNGAFSNS